ncbi:MAG: YebC/PmpR family DNA-binding transcriptional regulator [Candidatus Kapabacteria bacterium]|jgi:YebC/PmpR family DNA-binding regulatory protein|nr:YebC/PmpR family DNA-binding transcriptional regulator [Candidatus Kapabacteria bacterium]
MGRAFEFRRARKEKRWDKMAKAFTRWGKEIAISVKQSGPDPANNPRLRTAIQNAKGVNMPKDRIEAAIKKASSKDQDSYVELVYEGYAPHGVAVIVETATDNQNRTVANVRMHFNKNGGSLGTNGALDFVFDRKSVFTFEAGEISLDEIELELIDFGAEEIETEDGKVTVYAPYDQFAGIQKYFDQKAIAVISAELQRIPNTFVEVNDDQLDEVLKVIDGLEEDDDVQAVYHNMK